MTPPVILLGAGGHCSDVLGILEAKNQVQRVNEPIFIADDNWTETARFTSRSMNFTCVGSLEEALEIGPYLISIGYPQDRRNVEAQLQDPNRQIATPLVHPRAEIATTCRLGLGSVIFGNTWISPNVSTGEHCHISYGSTVGHETEIGSFVSLMPGSCVGGDVSIGDGVLVGANATILQGLSIGDDAIIGAGAVVTKEVKPGDTVVGAPARPVPSNGH